MKADLQKRGFWKESFWPLLIIGLAVLVYGHSLSNGFVWDDHGYLEDNPSMGSVKGLLGFWNPSDLYSGFPLTISCLWLEHRCWGLSPWGYHVFSLMIHILNALLLFGLVRRLVAPLAGLTALFFAIHPIQVETVAWIAEQKNLLCFFFFMLATHSFLDFDLSGQKKDYIKTFVFFIAALMSKGIAVCFVFVPFLFVWWKRGWVAKSDLVRWSPLFFLGVLGVLVPFYNEHTGVGLASSGTFLLEKTLLAGKNFFFYIAQIVFPHRFLTFYPQRDLGVTCLRDWGFPLSVVAVYAMLFFGRRRFGRGPFALLSLYGISIFPALGFLRVALFSVTDASDHFAYLSVPPVLLLLCAAGRRLFSRWPRLYPILIRSLITAGVSLLAVTSFFLTFRYKNDMTLFGELLVQSPGSYVANSRFGFVCLDNPVQCSVDRAILALEKAVRLGSTESLTFFKLGEAYEKKGALAKAKLAYLKAASGQDVYTQAKCFRKIGQISLNQNELSEAILYLEKSELCRRHPDYLRRRASFLRSMREAGRPEDLWIDRYLLGNAYFRSGDFLKAATAFRSVIAEAPWVKKFYEALGASLMNSGDLAGAIQAFERAVQLDPEDQTEKNNLAHAKQMQSMAALPGDAVKGAINISEKAGSHESRG